MKDNIISQYLLQRGCELLEKMESGDFTSKECEELKKELKMIIQQLYEIIEEADKSIEALTKILKTVEYLDPGKI